jgi:hypothetical protein
MSMLYMLKMSSCGCCSFSFVIRFLLCQAMNFFDMYVNNRQAHIKAISSMAA